MTPFKSIIGLESTLLLAVEKTKSEFIQHFVGEGYTEEEVGPAWHDLRKSPKAQKLQTRMEKSKSQGKRFPSSDGEQIEQVLNDKGEVIGGTVVTKEELQEEAKEEKTSKKKGKKTAAVSPDAGVETPNEEPAVEQEEVVEKKTKKGKAEKPAKEAKAPKAEKEGGDRASQVKELYTAGTTSPAAIAKATGINPSYVFTLIKKLKASGELK